MVTRVNDVHVCMCCCYGAARVIVIVATHVNLMSVVARVIVSGHGGVVTPLE